jgi:hypothetical protein
VLEAEEGEAEAALQYVEVLEDTEGAQANFADEGNHGAFKLVFQNFIAINLDACAFKFKSCMEP